MLVTYNWLKEFVDIDVSPEEIAKLLTNSGSEVEEIKYQNKNLLHVKVGKIIKIEKHPDAERLVVCSVDIKNEIVQIVTSATNVFEGAVVPVALNGADLVNGVKIQKSKFRGVDSFGMFCSGEELGITDDYYKGASLNGILILNNNEIVGEDIDTALGLDDVIFDVNVTANRPDCMSVVGIAREVSSLLHKPFKDKSFDFKVDKTDNILNHVEISVLSGSCPRYLMGAVKEIKIEKSPLWLKKRLNAVSIKPINNIVDITNYVLIEYGQPMHAFDASYIEGKKIIIRQANKGEEISVLNQNTYKLDESMMVIADNNKPVVIAGVIGGTNSCVNAQTKIALLESAVFDRKSIRVTSKKIGVRTDSSARYEKGVDLGSPEKGLKRALSLICELSAGTIIEGIIEKGNKKPQVKTITANLENIEAILGISVKPQDAVNILNDLGLKTTIDEKILTIIVPPHRDDIECDADVAEEIIRMYGYNVYDNLSKNLLDSCSFSKGEHDPILKKASELKNVLVDYGFYEALNYSICSPEATKKLLFKASDKRFSSIIIANPISEDLSNLRTSLAHSLLSTLSYNIKRGNENLKFFESGRVYLPKELPLKELPIEENFLAFASISNDMDFFVFKGIIESILCDIKTKLMLKRAHEPFLHPGISGSYFAEDGTLIASFGQVHPQVLKNYEISKAFYAEVNLDMLISFQKKTFNVELISKFQSVNRDLAIIANEDISCAEVEEVIKKAGGENLLKVELFDIYRNISLGENKKSLAYAIKFQDKEKTMSEEDINKSISKILKALEFKLGAKLR